MPVYLIRAGNSDRVKIGWGVNAHERIKALQAAHWETLHVLRTWDGDRKIEGRLHKRFESLRISRDWFVFHPDMLSVEVSDLPRCAEAAIRKRFPKLGSDHPVNRIISIFGGQLALARKIKTTQSSVWNWTTTGFIPYERICQIIGEAARLDAPVLLEPNDFFMPRSVLLAPSSNQI